MRVKLMALAKRRENYGQSEFVEMWLEHAQITRKFANLVEYRICVTREDSPSKGFDGLAELVWESVEKMNEDLSSELGVAAVKDADRFMTTEGLLLDEYIVETGGK